MKIFLSTATSKKQLNASWRVELHALGDPILTRQRILPYAVAVSEPRYLLEDALQASLVERGTRAAVIVLKDQATAKELRSYIENLPVDHWSRQMLEIAPYEIESADEDRDTRKLFEACANSAKNALDATEQREIENMARRERIDEEARKRMAQMEAERIQRERERKEKRDAADVLYVANLQNSVTAGQDRNFEAQVLGRIAQLQAGIA